MTEIKRTVAEARFHVRYAETDAMGIVHHASYVVWFEEGRSNYIRQKGASYVDMERQGNYLTVTEINVRYIRPAVYDQRVVVRCWLDEVKSRRLTFAYEIVDEQTGDIFVTGTSKHICIDKSGKVTRMPKTWAQWLE